MKNSSSRFTIFLVSVIALLFASCNPSKFLREDELLVTESTVEFVDKKKVTDLNETIYSLEALAKPRPNSGILHGRLFTYLKLRDHTKKKGLKSWIKRKVGELPSLYDPVVVAKSQLQIRKYLKDNGYLHSEVSVDTLVDQRTVKLRYNIDTEGQYRIRDVYLPKDSSDIASIVNRAQRRSLLKPGDAYNELLLTEERTRISEVANNRGYLEFDPTSIYYFVDTIPNTLELDIYVEVDDSQKNVKQKIFRLGKTVVYPNFNLSNEGGLDFKDTIFHRPAFYVIEDRPIVRVSVLDQLILQSEGEVYNKRLQDVTVSHLLDLGVFKFASLKYTPVTDSSATDQVLDRIIHLTPGTAKTFSTDLELNNRTGSFFGTTIGASYNHKNVFGRALSWNNRISAGVETQSGVTGSLINTLDFNLETSLSLPRLLFFPKIFFPKQTRFSGIFVPGTNLTLSNNFQQRTDLYTINSTSFSFGYNWKPNRRVEHTFNPLTIRQVNLLSSSAEFELLLNENDRLGGSFTDVFIAGSEYTYVRNTQGGNPKNPYWYYRGRIKSAGNLLSLFVGKGANGEPGEIFSQPYSQFVSLEQDVRYFFPFLRRGKLAFRAAPSIGVAYGNSTLLPFVEQYFVGGSNSVRAFQIRGVGPGSFFQVDTETNAVTQQFIDQTGDLKLEFSGEYRFPIVGFLKGAFFVDAGNVWLLDDDDSTPDGLFEFNRFYKEIAVGTGFGIRFDADFFVLRLDLATPIRQPVAQGVFAWTPENINFFTNFSESVLNLAIGYPF